MPARSDSARPTLICFAGDDWEGNPHSRHHLARRFAANMDVLFVEGVPMRSLAAGDSHEWRRVYTKLKRGVSPRPGGSLRTVAPGLHVLRPLPVPPAGPLGRAAQIANLRREIGRACKRLDLRGPRIAWFSLPVAAPLRGRLGEALDILYYQDRYDRFAHVDAKRLRAATERLARECDLVIATAGPLADDLHEMGASPLLAPHGVELERFANPGPTPADLATLERPLVGCVGLIDDYWDFDALRAIAEALPSGTVVVVGAGNVDLVRLRHPRISLLGKRPYSQMPAYMAAFDTCLIPFLVNDLTIAVNPIKLREYLAAGKPVVAAALPELEPYASVVELARTREDFVPLVLGTLDPSCSSPDAQARRRERVAGESWDGVATKIEGWIADALSKRSVRFDIG